MHSTLKYTQVSWLCYNPTAPKQWSQKWAFFCERALEMNKKPISLNTHNNKCLQFCAFNVGHLPSLTLRSKKMQLPGRGKSQYITENKSCRRFAGMGKNMAGVDVASRHCKHYKLEGSHAQPKHHAGMLPGVKIEPNVSCQDPVTKCWNVPTQCHVTWLDMARTESHVKTLGLRTTALAQCWKLSTH